VALAVIKIATAKGAIKLFMGELLFRGDAVVGV
jgi:hypothetical protein